MVYRALFLVFLNAFLISFAFARDYVIVGDVPTPFVEKTNQVLELADQGIYSLNGRIVRASSRFAANSETLIDYFEFDPKEYPILANAKRISFPKYLIDLQNTHENWAEYRYRRVNLVFRAHQKAGSSDIYLEPFLAQPLN